MYSLGSPGKQYVLKNFYSEFLKPYYANNSENIHRFKFLLRADLVTQWRNRRSFILLLLVPVIILISWKGIVEKFGGPFALSSCIAIGLVAIGLMGYSIVLPAIAIKEYFKRLRVAPMPGWCIMVSRLLIQLIMIVLLTTIIFIAGNNIDHITAFTVGIHH